MAILATLAAGVLAGCPGPIPTEVDVPNSFVDARADAPFGPVCLDDEALDLDFDKALGIDCTAIRTAISLRRTTAARIDVERARTRLRYELRRCCVSRQSLVEMMELHQGQGLPTDLTERRNHQIILGSLLCDPLTREIETRHYVARNPACLNPGQSNDNLGLDANGGGL